MLILSLFFSLLMLVSFDRFSTAIIASAGWAALSIAIFSGSAF